MERNYLIFIVVLVIALIIIAVVSQKMNFRFGDLFVKTDNRSSRNKLTVRGNSNKVKQGQKKGSKGYTSDNDLKVDGDQNELNQD